MSSSPIGGYRTGRGPRTVVIMKDTDSCRPATAPVPATAPATVPASAPGNAVGSAPRGIAARLPGLALAVAVAAVATAAGRLVPVVGGPVSGIALGALVAVAVRPGERTRPGVDFAGRRVLQAAVVLLGARLSLGQVLRAGAGSLPVMLVTLAVCLTAAYGIGRRLGVVGDLRTLIGVGTGVCGASAIAAVTPVVGAAGADVAYAVSTIFVFNVAAVPAFPALGHLLGMDQHAFGLFAGTAVNDMSSVVAVASAYGGDAADQAVVVKLARTLMIIPICLGLAALARRRAKVADARANSGGDAGVRTGTGGDVAAGTGAGGDVGACTGTRGDVDAGRSGNRLAPVRVGRLVPWFLVGFLALAAVNTAGLLPAGAHGPLGAAAGFLITLALSAIGLSTDLARLRRTGPAPLLLGGCLWLVVTATSLAVQFLTGHL